MLSTVCFALLYFALHLIYEPHTGKLSTVKPHRPPRSGAVWSIVFFQPLWPERMSCSCGPSKQWPPRRLFSSTLNDKAVWFVLAVQPCVVFVLNSDLDASVGARLKIAVLCDVSRGMHMGKRSELAFRISKPNQSKAKLSKARQGKAKQSIA